MHSFQIELFDKNERSLTAIRSLERDSMTYRLRKTASKITDPYPGVELQSSVPKVEIRFDDYMVKNTDV